MQKVRVLFSTLVICILCTLPARAQDMPTFKLMDNQSVGLTVAPFEKWGMAISDIDRNGYPDIFCLRWKSPGFSRVYLNHGGVFTEISGQTPLEALENVELNTTSALWVDYDNDGDRDLSLATEKALHLFRNDDNVFTEVSVMTGFVGQKPPGLITKWIYHIGGWADYDLDGDLDCAVTQDNNKKMYLFRNDGGTFTNVSAQARLDSSRLTQDYRFSWFDFDLDGDPDLIARPVVMRNDHGVFTDVTAELGLSGVIEISDRAFIDYDNDGDFDLFKSANSASSTTSNQLYENKDNRFVEVTGAVGLSVIAIDYFHSMAAGDVDNDGDIDIYLNRGITGNDLLLMNDLDGSGQRAFVDVAEFVGIVITESRNGAALFDYDRDGFLDIYIPSDAVNHLLYRNLANNGAHWVGFILEGTVSNRDAVGSLVTLYTGNGKQTRYTTCGDGFLRQGNPWVHFGMGLTAAVDSAVIRWPLGYRQVITDVAIDQYHTIKEPDQTSVDSDRTLSLPEQYGLANYPNPFNPSTTIAFSLPHTDQVSVAVYTLRGEKAAELLNARLAAGRHQVVWDARDCPSGIYLIVLRTQGLQRICKAMLMK